MQGGESILLTGLGGTVAPALAACLEAQGFAVVRWDRARVPAEDAGGAARFLGDVRPAAVAHLAMGSPDWAAALAAWCAQHGARFLYTSSVSVFSAREAGPIPPERAPDATDDYGRYKAESERRVREANPGARVARLGWQIGPDAAKNTMVRFLITAMRERGEVGVSSLWFPSCSFLEDTAAVLGRLLVAGEPGTYHLEGNDGYSMLDLAHGLDRLYGLGLKIRPTTDFQYDNRMCDGRVRMTPISAHLGSAGDV